MNLVLSCGWLAIVASLIWRAFRQQRLLRVIGPVAAPAGECIPRVAIIIPMRDEAANIGACLEGVLNQNYPQAQLRVLAVDDHSSDDTPTLVSNIARSNPQIALLRTPRLPRNWVGKSHACWVGAQAAPSEIQWFCFIDADVRLEPALLSSAIHYAAREKAQLLSLAPRQILESFAERLIMPCGLLFLAFYQDLARKQSPEGPDATATGQFMLIERSTYEAVGGHAAVCSAISEDLQLARVIKRSGGNVVLAGGERLIATRMYTGWRTLWPGLAKNIVDTLGGPRATAATAIAAVALAWSAILIPVIEAIRCAQGVQQACFAAALAGTATLGLLALHLTAAAHFRIPLWYGLIFPLGYTAGALIALDGLRRRLRGRVSWKGRTYP